MYSQWLGLGMYLEDVKEHHEKYVCRDDRWTDKHEDQRRVLEKMEWH
jgi:hypothetical protein